MEQKVMKEKIDELLTKKPEKREFKQTVEVVINFRNVDLEGKDKLNLIVNLPKGRGKDVEVGVFADGDLNLKAKKLSKHVLDRRELENYSKDKRKMKKFANSCYWLLTQPDLMPTIGKLWGVILGTRGKMPQPIPQNVDPALIIKKFKNSVRIKSKKNPNVHAPIGVEDMSVDDLTENLNSILESIERQIPKEKITSVYVKKTMGKSLRVI